MATRKRKLKAAPAPAPGTGYCVETIALSVFNLLSRARRPLARAEVFAMLRLPHVWDPRLAESEIDAGADHLLKLGWIDETCGALDLKDRHQMTQLGRDVVRDPTDPRGAKLLMLGAYQ